MYKYLFGPVPSRRLGMSLGVDLVPKKICSLNCLYCEVGHTTKLTTERREYILYDKVTSELNHYFANNPNPDYITFSGSGEPTLNSRIGDVLQFIKQKKPDIPVAVLTNGTLLYDKKIRDELMDANVVLPSLDAATEITFQKINRPAPQLTVEKYVQGLIDFRNEFSGQIWLEVLIVPEYNNNIDNLKALKMAFKDIKPDHIQLNTLDRPGTVADIHAASNEDLKKIVDYWKLDNVEIIGAAVERKNIQSYRKDAETTILGTITRRPCTVDDLVKILGLHINEINKYLDVLEAEGKIESVRQERGVFYQIKHK
ncbi:radical SAM protein [candidate division KSB1 bacterium]|nr:radical SAM protein [candidate division KSB1 bacterium]MBL7103500.1 radical SAM protein [Bacteroidales bacterium]